jgi:hypothetical protein
MTPAEWVQHLPPDAIMCAVNAYRDAFELAISDDLGGTQGHARGIEAVRQALLAIALKTS